MSTPSSPPLKGSFFAEILTRRHLLTQRRGIAVAALVSVLLVSVLLIGTLSGPKSADSSSSGTAPTDNASPPTAARPLAVVTRPISQAGPDFLSQTFTGIISAKRTTQLAAKALGRIEHIAVDIGDRVQAGQTLVELDRAQLQSERNVVSANLAAAQAQLEELRHGPRRQELDQSTSRVAELRSMVELQQANLIRSESLRGSSAISAQELDENRFRTDAIEAQLQAAEKSLELLKEGTRSEQIKKQQAVVTGLNAQLDTIDIQLAEKRLTAPYSGHIQTRLVDEGQIVAAGQPLLEVVETTALEVHVGLPVDLCTNLSNASLTVKLGEVDIPTTLARVSPSIHSATRTREVVLALDQHSYQQSYHQLPIGTAVQVELKTQTETQGHWIPTSALTSGVRGLWAVFVAIPLEPAQAAAESQATHRIERRQVELLRSQGDWSEVRGPITGSEQLVIDGVHRIVAGQKVKLEVKGAGF